MPDAPSPGASLTVLGGPLKGKTLLLEDAVDEILVGSDPDSRFCLDLPGVSPIHARIWLDLAGAKVYDTRSSRGIFINDSRVQGEAVLHDGDILWLGPPGEEDSVMIRYRGPSDLEGVQPMPVADGAPSAEDQRSAFSIGDDELAFAEPPPVPPPAASPPAPSEGEPLAGLLDDFAFLEEPTAAPPAPSPVPAAPAADEFRAPPPLPDEFLVDTPGAPAEASWTPAAGEPAFAEDAAFFVDEPQAPAPPPTVAPPPVPPPRPVTPTPIPPAVPAPPPAPARPAAPTAAKADAAPPARRPDRPAGERPAPPPSPRVRPERPAPAQRPGRPAAASPLVRYAAIGAGVLVLVAIAGFLLVRGMGAPSIDSIAPSRARVGEILTVTGKNFSPTPSSNLVRFEGSRDGRVVSATPTQLQVEVPDVPAATGRPNRVPVTVTVGARTSDASLIAVYQAPRIHGLSPSVAMPGEDVVLAGSGWGQGAAVRFGNVDVPVVEVTSSTIKVRVPQIAGPPGTSVPVVVSMGADPSNPAPFILGRLPLILSVEPRTAGAGDIVTIHGRGFTRDPARDVVRVAGTRAVVGTSSEEELKFVVPFLEAPGGDVPLELRIAGLDSVGQSTLTLAAAADPVDLRFSAEPFEDEAGHLHAVISTALGPTFVLSAAGGHSALERAFETQRRLNEAAAALKASRDADIEVRVADDGYGLFLSGQSQPLVEARPEDAAAYNEDWTKVKGRGGPATPGRLASWWSAVLRDLVLLLARGEKPQYAAALSPEGKPLGDLFEAARRSAAAGVPRSVLAQGRPPARVALRTLALRVPSSVSAPAGEPTTAAAPTTSLPPLRLAGDWSGSEIESGERKFVTASFAPPAGTLTYQRALTITVTLSNVTQGRDGSVRFEAQAGRGQRYYAGKWDGQKITGKISSDAAGQESLGNFELEQR
ncbi:MAG: hypothetical protein DMF83_09905 [Acidobacteria bacterium]|nr:MAG: hypothetical protein DMF83_09905 [Acidobacteriota bacterium]